MTVETDPKERPLKGPVVYRGSGHYVTCDADGNHRDWFTSNDRLLRVSCRCDEWGGGCPAKSNARLLSAAYTSYDKHCGERAVGCAEGDFLGEALEVLRRLLDDHEYGFLTTRHVNLAKTVLAKAEGGAS